MSYWDHNESRDIECISGACFMIKKKVFNRISGFDDNYLFYGEDLDMCHKVIKLGKKIRYCSNAEVTHFGKGSADSSSEGEIFYEIVLYSSLRRYFKKNMTLWTYALMNIISMVAAIFRILLILIVRPFVESSGKSDFNFLNLQKYFNILMVSLGLLDSKKIKDKFKKATLGNDKKNVLIAPGFLPNSYCIVEKIFIEYAERLSDQYKVYWLHFEENPLYVKYVNSDTVNIVHLDLKNKNLIEQFIYIYRFIKIHEFDLIITAFGFYRFFVSMAGKLNGAIVVWHECWLSLKGKGSFLKKIYYKHCIDSFIANSNFTKDHLVQGGVPLERIIVINRGYHKNDMMISAEGKISSLRRELSIKETDIVIGMVSVFRNEKNHKELLDVFVKLLKKYNGIILLLIGGAGVKENNTEPDIRKTVDALGLNGKVILTGFRQDVQRLYEIMDIFAFTSINEPWGNAVVEAMAKKLPVVCYDCGGFTRIIENNLNGYLVEPHDVNGFYDILTKLIEDRSLRNKVGQEARKKFTEMEELDFTYSVEKNVQIIESLLDT